MSAGLVGRDLYYATTDKKGTTQHRVRVWDAARFMEARRVEGAKAEKDEDKFTVSMSSEEDFKAK